MMVEGEVSESLPLPPFLQEPMVARQQIKWWIGWVKFSYYDGFTQSEKVATRDTLFCFTNKSQAQGAANVLAKSLAAPPSLTKRQRQYLSKTDKRPSQLNVIETGVREVDLD